MPGIFDTVVDANVQALLRREQRLLVELRETLEREQVDERRRVDELLATLEDLFTIVIVGEFNAGKSSLINALFGAKLRVEGPIPVDDVISILRYGEQASQRQLSDYVVEQFYPVEFLRNITLVDTPGTNSIVQRHQEITEDYIPRADLVLFVTSIDRPLSESERKFLEYIREWGKKVVFVLNKIDTKTDEEIAQVVEYLKTNVRAIFGFDPVIFPVREAGLERSRQPPRDGRAAASTRWRTTSSSVLSEKERIRIKLTAPLETILSLSKKQFRMIESRREVLAADKARIDVDHRSARAGARAIWSANFRQFVVRIDNLLMDLERRGLDFLDRYVRIQHVMMLRDASRFREEFERQVFQGWKGNIDTTIQEAVDWLVKENMKLWNGTVDAFHRRAEADAKNEEVIGRVGREFAYNREEVYSRMRRNAEQRLSVVRRERGEPPHHRQRHARRPPLLRPRRRRPRPRLSADHRRQQHRRRRHRPHRRDDAPRHELPDPPVQAHARRRKSSTAASKRCARSCRNRSTASPPPRSTACSAASPAPSSPTSASTPPSRRRSSGSRRSWRRSRREANEIMANVGVATRLTPGSRCAGGSRGATAEQPAGTPALHCYRYNPPPYGDHGSDQGSAEARRRDGHRQRLALQQAHLGEAAVPDHPRRQRLSCSASSRRRKSPRSRGTTPSARRRSRPSASPATSCAEPRAPGGVELHVEEFEVIGLAEPYPISPKEHGTDFLMDHRHLWLRSTKQHAVLRVRSEIEKAIRDFFYERDFVLIDSPILTANAAARGRRRSSRPTTSATRRTSRSPASSTSSPRPRRSARSTASARRSAPRSRRRAAT